MRHAFGLQRTNVSRTQASVHDERQVVGGDPGQRRPVGLYPQHLDRATDENVIDPGQRQPAWKGRHGAAAWASSLRIVQSGCEPLMHPRSWQSVEIAEKHDRLPAEWMPKPLGAEEHVDLEKTFRAAKTEMGVDHLKMSASDFDVRPQGSPRLETGVSWQRPGPDQLCGSGGQDRVPVLLFHHPHGWMKEHVHPELISDGVRLVDPAATCPADIELLQSDNVWPAGGDHLGNAGRRQAAIRAAAVMHIVRQDPEHPSAIRWDALRSHRRCSSAHPRHL